VPEVAGHLRCKVRTGALAVEVDDADIAQLRRSSNQRIEQDRWRRSGAVKVDLFPGADAGDRFLGADYLHVMSLTSRLCVTATVHAARSSRAAWSAVG
jgi:hypothetical protein